MNFAKTLTRNEMKNIMAGDGPCRVYVSGYGWSGCTSVDNAQNTYQQFDSASGYCCASCGSGNFSNASAC